VLGTAWLAAFSARSSIQPLATAVDAVGMTVSDMDRAVDFYSRVLSFGKVSDVEVWGDRYEHLEGLFGLRMRVVRMRLGDESVELTEYLTPKGRPIPLDSRSNDRWFQHVAIIVSDIDRAYQLLRKNRVQHASTGPQRLPDWNKNAAGISAFYFKDPDGHTLEILQFPQTRAIPSGTSQTANSFWASITRLSWSVTRKRACGSIATCLDYMSWGRARTMAPNRSI